MTQPIDPPTGSENPSEVQRSQVVRGLPVLLLLILILAIGAYFRSPLTGIFTWDGDFHLHPDERFLTMVEAALDWPSGTGEYFDSEVSPLNPYNRGYDFFVYGTLPLFIVKWASIRAGMTDYWHVHLVGRALSSVFDLGTVLMVYVIGARLYSRRVGLLSSALLSATVLHIQHAHFFTVESYTVFFTCVALYAIILVAQRGAWYDYAFAGTAVGLAAACKVSSYTLGIVLAIAIWLDMRRLIRAGMREGLVEHLAARLVVGGVLGALVIRIFLPYAFEGPGVLNLTPSARWLSNMKSVQGLMNGSVDYPPSHQWTNRIPLIFPGKNMILWGMGMPLGITVWCGWGLALWELVRRQKVVHLVPWVWVTITFLYQGSQFVKSVRYLLPAYPLFILLGAYFLSRITGCALRTSHRGWQLPTLTPYLAPVLRVLGLVLPIVVLGGTFLWAFAFTRIYTRPHSRVQASRWIYDNVPRGSVIANEHWDDALPLSFPDKHKQQYYPLEEQMTMYDEDTPEKLEKVLDQLNRIDYIFLSSNRLYLSIPRLPMRYPMTTEYYRLLFNGELGFDLAAKITSFPNLGPVKFNDEGSDEAFTVYDHPQVHIFRKTPRFSGDRARELLGNVDWNSIQRVKPVEAGRTKSGLVLSVEDQDIYARSGTWSAMFNPRDLANRWPVVAWLVAIELVGLATFPLAYWLLPSLADRGYFISKSLGIVLLAWSSWLAASLRVCTHSRAAVAVWLLALVLLGGILAWFQRRGIWGFVKERWTLLLTAEGLFLGAFALFLLIRMGNPDLWHPVTGGEKPMDFAYLNAIVKSAYFPPYDPWYAGGHINYYYFGQLIAATLIKLTGIVPWVAYNLAVPLFYSLSALGAFVAVYHLVLRRGDAVCRSAVAHGLLGALFLGLMGNLAELRLVARTLARLSTLSFQSTIPGLGVLVNSVVGLYRAVFEAQSLSARTEWWYWNATRAIAAAPDEVGPINEFPFFTFLYGDLHAHLIALPFALLVMVMAIGWMRSWTSRSTVPAHRVTVSGLVRVSLAGLCIGVLWVTNTWDYPTYILVMLVALVAGLYLAATRSGRTWTMSEALRAFGWRAAVLVGISYGSFLPFHLSYVPGYTSVERWRGSQTRLDDYLIMHGLFLFVLTTFLIVDLLRREHGDGPAGLLRLALARWERLPRVAHLYALLVREPSLWYRVSVWGMVAVVCSAILMLIVGSAVIALSLPMISLGALMLLWRPRRSPLEHFLIFIIILAWALTLVVEVVVLKGDIGRMNTVFKFYLQVWVLWALAAAAVLPRIRRRLRHWTRCSSCWRTAFVLLLLGCLLYVPLATQAKVSDRFDRSIGPTLDGMAYMATATYQEGESELHLEWDRQAIRWMLANVKGSPVVLEANVLLYRWGSRVSIYTGLPSIVGWDWHQRQQRGHVAGEAVNRRVREVQEIYGTTDLERAQQLMRQYRVKYVYLGELEHAVYPAEGLGKFERWADEGFLEEVYRNAGVVLYEVAG